MLGSFVFIHVLFRIQLGSQSGSFWALHPCSLHVCSRWRLLQMDPQMQGRPNGSNNVDVGLGVNVSHALFNMFWPTFGLSLIFWRCFTCWRWTGRWKNAYRRSFISLWNLDIHVASLWISFFGVSECAEVTGSNLKNKKRLKNVLSWPPNTGESGKGGRTCATWAFEGVFGKRLGSLESRHWKNLTFKTPKSGSNPKIFTCQTHLAYYSPTDVENQQFLLAHLWIPSKTIRAWGMVPD